MPAENLQEWFTEECPECGITWDKPSPDCPKVIFNRHPLTAIMPMTKAAPDVMTPRLYALAKAREHVAELYVVKNDKGYPRFTGNVSDVLNQELRIAEFLLRSDND